MAASIESDNHAVSVEKRVSTVLEHVSMNTGTPSNFPDKFQDFFAAVTEDSDDLPNMLEDKLIPRKRNAESTKIFSDHSTLGIATEGISLGNQKIDFSRHRLISLSFPFVDKTAKSTESVDVRIKKFAPRQLASYPSLPKKQEGSGTDTKGRKWSKRAFQRRSSEIEVRLHRSSLSGTQGHGTLDGPKSPTPTRRRSSSIAVARPTPDLHRFLQAEAGPWGHLSPSPRSPNLTPPAVSPGAASTSSHLSPGTSPGGPSPTSPAGSVGQGTGSRAPVPRQYRGRTSSMPAVPRHRH
uniref:Uncharacterized protein n=1 Tax=Vespula pensylvanica TaxID=30213 RepID=A0A834P5N3_VESPE|nr:hypothetical protein H0235_005836 [Vespula pensylvanica]